MELSNLLRVYSSMQSMTLWLVSKHDTFQNHVNVQAQLEAAAPSRARRPHRAGSGEFVTTGGKSSAGLCNWWKTAVFSLPPGGYRQRGRYQRGCLSPWKTFECIFLPGKRTLIIIVHYSRPRPHLANNKAEFHDINTLEQQCLKGPGYSFKDNFAWTGDAAEWDHLSFVV